MSLFGWFRRKRNNDDVHVVNIKDESIPLGQMASSSPKRAAGQLSLMLDQQKSPTKILVVGSGGYSKALTEYSLKMAQRLDCKIIALDVTETPLRYSGEKREKEENRFFSVSKDRVASFAQKAESMHIAFDHVAKVNSQEEAIAQLSKQDAGIRYVLTEPEEALCANDQNKVVIPVFDLACSRF